MDEQIDEGLPEGWERLVDERFENEGWERLDWDKAVPHPMTVSGFMLVVDGVSDVPMDVEIYVWPIGVAPVDYHPNIVRGRRREPVIQKRTEWQVQEDTRKLGHGTKGFVLVGATKRQYFPPKEGDEGEGPGT